MGGVTNSKMCRTKSFDPQKLKLGRNQHIVEINMEMKKFWSGSTPTLLFRSCFKVLFLKMRKENRSSQLKMTDLTKIDRGVAPECRY